MVSPHHGPTGPNSHVAPLTTFFHASTGLPQFLPGLAPLVFSLPTTFSSRRKTDPHSKTQFNSVPNLAASSPHLHISSSTPLAAELRGPEGHPHHRLSHKGDPVPLPPVGPNLSPLVGHEATSRCAAPNAGRRQGRQPPRIALPT